MKKAYITAFALGLSALSLCISCSDQKKDEPNQMFVDARYTFGKELDQDESGATVMVLSGESQSIDLSLYDPHNGFSSVESFEIFTICNYDGGYKDGKFSDDAWTSGYAANTERSNSFENEDLGEGETVNHTFGWFNLQIVKSSNQAQKLILTLPKNTTGEVRGVRIDAGNRNEEGNWVIGEIKIYQMPLQDENPFPMKIRYKGQVYSTMAQIDKDGEYIYDNPEFEKMMRFIDTTPNIDAVVMDDEIVDYFDVEDEEYKELQSTLNRPIDPSLSGISCNNPPMITRADGFQYWKSTDLGYFAVFDNDTFAGKYISYVPPSFHNTHNLRNLKEYDMNDKITSLAVYYGGTNTNVCAVLTVWEDTDYNYSDNNIPRKKHRVSFIASYNNRKISRDNLKNIKLINASGSWNDRISAISCHFAYYDRKLKDY